MAPRILSGDRVIIFQDRTPRVNTIFMAESPDNKCFLKVLRSDPLGKFYLESINPLGVVVTELEGWKLCGYAVCVMGDTGSQSRNIEWNFGAPLKA